MRPASSSRCSTASGGRHHTPAHNQIRNRRCAVDFDISSERLGRHRWKIERSIAWLFGFRRLTVQYERKGSHCLAFLSLAAAFTCYKRLANSPRETSS